MEKFSYTCIDYWGYVGWGTIFIQLEIEIDIENGYCVNYIRIDDRSSYKRFKNQLIENWNLVG